MALGSNPPNLSALDAVPQYLKFVVTPPVALTVFFSVIPCWATSNPAIAFVASVLSIVNAWS